MSRFARFRLSFRSGQESPARRDPIELKRPHRVPGARSSVAGADIANVSADSSGHPLPSRGVRCLERGRLLLPGDRRVNCWAILEFTEKRWVTSVVARRFCVCRIRKWPGYGTCFDHNPWTGCGLRVRCAHTTLLRGWHYEALCRGVCHSGWRSSAITRRSAGARKRNPRGRRSA